MAEPIDPDKLAMFSFQLFSKLEGAVTSGMVHLGDRLGLYVAMRAADGPMTSRELADATGLHERWVREWAYNQASARLIVADEHERFSLSPEAAAVLADSTNSTASRSRARSSERPVIGVPNALRRRAPTAAPTCSRSASCCINS